MRLLQSCLLISVMGHCSPYKACKWLKPQRSAESKAEIDAIWRPKGQDIVFTKKGLTSFGATTVHRSDKTTKMCNGCKKNNSRLQFFSMDVNIVSIKVQRNNRFNKVRTV